MSGLVAQRQKRWLEAIEKRITATTTMLGAMKSVKLCGLSEPLSSSIQLLRVTELEISKAFRRLLIWALGFSKYTFIGHIWSGIFSFVNG